MKPMKVGALLMPSHPPERGIGSDTVTTRRIDDLQEQTGGFGHLIIASYDAADERDAWERSLRLLISEVMPACSTRSEPTSPGVAAGAIT